MIDNRDPPLEKILSQEVNMASNQQATTLFDINEFVKVRKKWLTSFFTFLAWRYLFTLLVYSIELCPLLDKKQDLFLWIAFAFIAIGISLLLFPWITYYCAYKKHGTKWLLWVIIVTPLKDIEAYTKLSKAELYAVWPFILIDAAILLYFLFNCVQLRRVNVAKRQNIRKINVEKLQGETG